MRRKQIFVAIPAYNEAKTIGKVIERVKRTLSRKYNFKILVVDDGSKDKTVKIARKAGAIVVSHEYNRGLAKTFQTAIDKCLKFGAEIIVHIDADGQYRAEEIPKLLKEIDKGYDLILGSRFLGKIEQMPFIKKQGNKLFSRTISGIIRHKISDCQTGFRAFTKKVATSLPIISSHTYTQEQIIRAVRAGFKIKEVPIYFDKRKEGPSRLISNPFEYGTKAWINIFRIYRDFAPLKFFGAVGSFLLLIGIIIGLYFIGLHLTSGIEGHLGLFFLMIILLLTGLQIILFGFLAEMVKR